MAMRYDNPPPTYDSLQLSIQNQPNNSLPGSLQQVQYRREFEPTIVFTPIQSQPTPSPVINRIETNRLASNLGPNPQLVICPSCQVQVISEVTRQPTLNAQLSCLVLFCIGCWPCSIMPLLMDSCLKINHFCPHCRRFLGSTQPR